MSKNEIEVCEACGVTAEMGYVISEGDDVAEVTIYADSRAAALDEFNKYASLATEVNPNAVHDINLDSDFAFAPLNAKFKFECSAEKLIFELKSRSLAK